ncbi:VQ motif containing protein [Parasponia andersonii]|uniref:VQ motif containing protein n=1 Tax=Parasponia andersonii TaxID=3476 RepID=A0A2P5DHA5_PARAD|nr:VQ motif containing protein [Parasponia andersonii]
MGSPNRGVVKVVLIETQYIETDKTSFKSVVQSLTGKDACVSSWNIEKSSFGNDGSKSSSNKRKRGEAALDDVSTIDYGIDNAVFIEDGSDSSPFSSLLLSKGMSFKDLDRMLMFDMPPMEDLQVGSWMNNCR